MQNTAASEHDGQASTQYAATAQGNQGPLSAQNVQNTASFSGEGNQGLQIGQHFGNLNFYSGSGPRPSFERSAEYVQSLSSEYRRQKDINPDRTPETCLWFLNDDRFRAWRDATDARLLHVYAGPGCGKSVLAKALVDEGLAANTRTSLVLYFFFKAGQGEQDRAASAIAAMLHQLYTALPDSTFKDLAESRYEAHGPKLAKMFDELWDIFLATCAAVDNTITCIIDALDECEEPDRRFLIPAISKFYSGDPSSKLKLLVTSRPYPDVNFIQQTTWTGFRTSFIRIDGDEKSDAVAEEINRVIEAKVPTTIPRVSQSVQKRVIETLQSMENRTYLWLRLILEYVEKNIAGHGTEKKLKELIKKVPPSVDEAYENMLHRSPDPDVTRMLLSIALVAKRPLLISETTLALELAQNDYDYLRDIETETDEQFKESLKELCGLLLTVHDSRIYFLHETVREFLLQNGAIPSASPSQWKSSIHIVSAEATMAEACILYLCLRDFEPTWNGIFPYWNETVHFSVYVRAYWLNHYRGAQGRLREGVFSRLCEFLEDPSRSRLLKPAGQFLRIVRRAASTELQDSCPLSIATDLGLVEVVRLLIARGADVNKLDIPLGLPLHIACRKGNEEIVQLLLEQNPDMLNLDALNIAAWRGHVEILRSLLQKHLELYPGRLPEEKLLENAAKSGNPSIVRLVLDSPAGIILSREKIRLALGAASSAGYTEVIQVLLKHKSIIHALGKKEHAALSATYGTSSATEQARGAARQARPSSRGDEQSSSSRDTCSEAISINADPNPSMRIQLLVEHFQRHPDCPELISSIDGTFVRFALLKAVDSGDPFVILPLFEQGLIQGKIKTPYYTYILKTAARKRRVWISRLLLDRCPSDIALDPRDVRAVESEIAQYE